MGRLNDEFTTYNECSIRRRLNMHMSVAVYSMNKNNLVENNIFLKKWEFFVV
jgi:hypothetical protein